MSGYGWPQLLCLADSPPREEEMRAVAPLLQVPVYTVRSEGAGVLRLRRETDYLWALQSTLIGNVTTWQLLRTLYQGCLAYLRFRPALLAWLERAQQRRGDYEEGGVARLRDLEEYEADL